MGFNRGISNFKEITGFEPIPDLSGTQQRGREVLDGRAGVGPQVFLAPAPDYEHRQCWVRRSKRGRIFDLILWFLLFVVCPFPNVWDRVVFYINMAAVDGDELPGDQLA